VAQLLSLWSGLGYNRRALALQKTGQKVIEEYQGNLPASPEILQTFPGIGKATSASICAFAFNIPTIFIETNIRAVYIHTFFENDTNIHDKILIKLVAQTLDKENARHWYYALMDYGVMLKKLYQNPSRKSAHYTKQSKFEGSERQIRGMILKILTQHGVANFDTLCLLIVREPVRIERNLRALCNEGFIKQDKEYFFI
jgi:A/G-specific adenine glycosylase